MEHPALAGHFPGHPVVPGVVLLDAVLAELARRQGAAVRVSALPSVKFLAPLKPGQDFEIGLDERAGGQAGFTVTAGGERLATGSLRYARTG
ncbi:MAG TPA: hypothetical protein VGA00_01815 [Acidiferrobacterales bacterium]